MAVALRTFVAITIPGHVLAAIGAVQNGIRSSGFKIRWVRQENIHLTLKFLGDVLPGNVDAVHGAMVRGASGIAPFSLHAESVGVFPGVLRPRVLWAGTGGQTQSLFRLQKNLDGALASVGFPMEKRPFVGHLTLGRVKGGIDAKRLEKAMGAFSRFATEPFDVDRIDLIKSDLTPAGARYTVLRSAGLGGLRRLE